MIDTAMLVARVVGFAATGSVRPAATLFAVQLLTAGLVHFGTATLPAGAAWSISPLALGVGLAVCVLEWLFQHTEGADELVRTLHADKLVAAALAMPATLLLVSLTAVAEPGAVLTDGPATDLALATQKLAESGRPLAEQAGFLGLAVALNLALTWLRGELRDFVESVHLERIWAWLETGGVVVGLVLLALAPAVGLVLVALFVLAGAGVWVGSRAVAALLDAARRRQCLSCRRSIRVEAVRCRYCNAEAEPLRWLGQGDAPAPVGALTRPPG